MSQLYHKGAEFIWTDLCQETFDQLKKYITTAPALRPINYTSEEPVILSVDSSKEAAGMILSQEVIDEEGKRKRIPARYGSIPMSERESRYSQPKLELFGLYRALRHWRIYIIGVKKLIVEVDAKYIAGMINQAELQPDAAVNRWVQEILMFDFELRHVPAERFLGPDALSRRPKDEEEIAYDDDDSWLDNIALLALIPDRKFPSFSTNITPFERTLIPSDRPQSPPLQCFMARANQDQMLHEIEHFLTTLESPVIENVQAKRRFLAKAMEFFVKDSRLFKKNGHHPPLLVIFDSKKKQSILLHAHENLGHRGMQAVYEVVRNRFYWPHLRTDVHHHVKSCHECQIRKLTRHEVPLTISQPSILFAKIYIDIMHMPLAQGFRYIVAAKDDLSGTCEATPLRRATAKNLAKFFWENIYCRYGAPIQVVTDNGPEVKEAFEKLLKRMGIPQIRITPYNHHANGVVERGHFILREAIVKACKDKISDWPTKVPEVVFADRVTVNRVTGFSPFQLLHATEPILPLDLVEATFLVEEFKSGMSTESLLAARARQLAKHPEDVERAAEVLKKARFASKEHFEKRFFKRLTRATFKPNDLVLVRNMAIEMSHDRKHKPRYLGPYEVIKRTNKGNYRLMELDGTPLHYTYASRRVIPYISRKHSFMHSNQDIINKSDMSETDSDLDVD